MQLKGNPKKDTVLIISGNYRIPFEWDVGTECCVTSQSIHW